MTTRIADQKNRITLPKARPGDVFEIRQQGEGRYLVEKLESASRAPRPSAAEIRKAMDAHPLQPTLSWPQLSRKTRG